MEMDTKNQVLTVFESEVIYEIAHSYSVRAEVKQINPDSARSILDNCHYEFQRNIKKNQVNFLLEQMKHQRFHPTSSIIFADCADGNMYLLNGYHTLNAICKSSLAFDMVIVYFKVKDKNEASEIYTHIDIGFNRSALQRLKALNISHEIGVTNHQVGKSTSAMRYMSNGFPVGYNSRKFAIEDEKLFLINWKDEIFLFFELFDSIIAPRHIKNRVIIAPVLSVFLILIRCDFDNAIDFLTGVIEGSALGKDDPRWYLRERLIETARSEGKRKIVSNGYLARLVARCWNNFILNKKVLTHIKVTALQIQNNIVLLNTPFDGSISTFDYMELKAEE